MLFELGVCIAAGAVAFTAMYYEETWGMRYNLSVTRNLPWGEEALEQRITATQNLTSKLLAISTADAPSYFIGIAEGWKLGAAVYVITHLCQQAAARLAVRHEAYRRYDKRAHDTKNPVLQRSAPSVSRQKSMEHPPKSGEGVQAP